MGRRTTGARGEGRRRGRKMTGAAVKTDGVDDAVFGRRAALAGKCALAIGELVAFPWLTESATRPMAIGDEDVGVGSTRWLASLLPAERDAETMALAKAALKRGEAALANGDTATAITEMSKVERLVPREYKLNQRAWLALSEAHKKAGDGDGYLEYKNKTWWWGRGLRWPGWYIIAYLSARSAYFDAKEEEATFTMNEALLIAPLWVGGLYLLVTYGLPDY